MDNCAKEGDYFKWDTDNIRNDRDDMNLWVGG